MAITKVTAAPIPAAVPTLFDTPRKGQMPSDWAKTTLFAKMEPMIIANNSISIKLF
jgi:hypothetical protein